jgi:hypothetical protein
MKYYVALKPCFDRYGNRRTELAKGTLVLEYGCARVGNAIGLSGIAKHVEGSIFRRRPWTRAMPRSRRGAPAM